MSIIDDIFEVVDSMRMVERMGFNGEPERLEQLVKDYRALAPDWQAAPEWARWYAIDASGDGYWYVKEPMIDAWEWVAPPSYAGCVENVLPLGVDFRLCKWARPEAPAA